LTLAFVGELNADLILYGLPPVLESEREHLADDFAMTLGSSSAIFAHNISLLGAVLVSLPASRGSTRKFCLDRLSESGVDVSASKSFQVRPRDHCDPSSCQAAPNPDLSGHHFRLAICSPRLGLSPQRSPFHLSSFFLLRGLRPKLPNFFFN